MELHKCRYWYGTAQVSVLVWNCMSVSIGMGLHVSIDMGLHECHGTTRVSVLVWDCMSVSIGMGLHECQYWYGTTQVSVEQEMN